MTSAVMQALTKWRQIRQKLDILPEDPAINGRFACASEEEGIVLDMLSKAFTSMGNVEESIEYALEAMTALGHRFPTTKAGKIKMIVENLIKVQWMAKRGHKIKFSTVTDADRAYTGLLQRVGYLSFRINNDKLSFFACTVRSLTLKKGDHATWMTSLHGVNVVAPALKLWSVYDWTLDEINRIAAEDPNSAISESILSSSNGIAYFAKAEFKSSAAMYLRGAIAFGELHDYSNWMYNLAWSSMCRHELGERKKGIDLLEEKGWAGLKTLDNQGVTRVYWSTMSYLACWGGKKEAAKLLDDYHSHESKLDPDKRELIGLIDYLRFRAQMISEEEALVLILKNVDTTRRSFLCMYTLSTTATLSALLHFHDNLAIKGERASVAGYKCGDIMVRIKTCSDYLQKLGKKYTSCEGWAAWSKSCVYRRQGSPRNALHSIESGIESANRINAKACLACLWLEKGKCEEELSGELSTRRTSMTTASGKRRSVGRSKPTNGNTITPESEASQATKSYTHAMDIAGEHELVFIYESCKNKLRKYGINRSSSKPAGDVGDYGTYVGLSPLDRVGGTRQEDGRSQSMRARDIAEDAESGRDGGGIPNNITANMSGSLAGIASADSRFNGYESEAGGPQSAMSEGMASDIGRSGAQSEGDGSERGSRRDSILGRLMDKVGVGGGGGARRESGRRESGRRESGRRESGRRESGRRESGRRESGGSDANFDVMSAGVGKGGGAGVRRASGRRGSSDRRQSWGRRGSGGSVPSGSPLLAPSPRVVTDAAEEEVKRHKEEKRKSRASQYKSINNKLHLELELAAKEDEHKGRRVSGMLSDTLKGFRAGR
jgi:hypothetical protein